ncbi:MFS allantoate transporter [Dacryopinax primogenitus]|uniref:MFS allantoate transporter n=1 Tax=Dacryopinax primogenitus (strain DJM 731) TaxID=1858805 RepID=M5G3S6_DACPD|nr:MFS allantoate transporter [Dacryopinax primogenitus]EJT98412.1 MFS allantoate transporter [Dacryopinax primogenitus]
MADTDNEKRDLEKTASVDIVDQRLVEQYEHAKAHMNTDDADDALKIASELTEISPEEEAALLRKIDWHVLPLLCVVYGLQYLDKTTLSYSSIMGIQTFAHLQGQQYSWLGSIFYFGYLVWEYPTNRLLQRLPLGKYTSFNIMVWGAILACMAGTKDFAGLMAVRFFLGLFEASVSPGFALFTSQWYKVGEQGARTGIWFSFNGFAQIFGGVVAYGIGKADAAGQLSIAGWKIVFLLTGLLTFTLGVIAWFFMPDSPLTAYFLSPQERAMAIQRIRLNQQGVGNKHFKWYQVREALTDVKTWLFVAYSLIADIPNGGISNYFSILIESFGFTSLESLLYGAPGGAIEVVTLIGFLWLGDKFKLRLLFGACSEAISLLGILLVYALPDELKVGKLIGYYFTQASATGFVVLLSLVSSNVAGYTKKTTVSALYLIAYCVGNLIGPQIFQTKDAPRYTPALITIVVCWILCIILLLVIWFVNARENRRRDAFRKSPEYVHVQNQEFLDLTDGENMDFRYRT